MQLSYISADELLADSIALALDVVESGYRPDLLIALWRGGTPVGIAMQEVFEFLDMPCEHFAIRSKSYTAPGQQQSDIQLWGMEMLQPSLRAGCKVLLVDDVFDSGRTMQAVVSALQQMALPHAVTIKLATPWSKPGNNQTRMTPDYHLHTTDNWLVFPHEIHGLSAPQVLAKPGLSAPLQRLLQLQQRREKP